MYTIGVDIGGTNARIALLDENFNIIKKTSLETKDNDFDFLIDSIADHINGIDEKGLAKHIGVCSPGPLDKEKGMILDAPNLPNWAYKPFINILEKKTKRKIIYTNDANAAAISQAINDQSDCLVFMTVSTGVGGGIVYKGKLLEGKRSYAGEFGMMIIADEKRTSSKLYQGSLESLCSGTALALEASKLYKKDITSKEVFERYRQKEDIAIIIIDKWVEHFSRAIANIMQTIEPDVFYIGGSVVLNNPWLLDLVKSKVKDKVYEGLRESIDLRIAKYGDDAGIVGTAYNAYINSEEG
ncbi:MAG: ROK family protein [Tissierellia bacterium]|nr:ROK family protein [Tissierellia bacterium]